MRCRDAATAAAAAAAAAAFENFGGLCISDADFVMRTNTMNDRAAAAAAAAAPQTSFFVRSNYGIAFWF